MLMNLRGPGVLALAAALVTAATGCERPAAGARAAQEVPKRAAAATRVDVVRPVRQAARRKTEQPGQVEAAEVAPIFARLSGYARSVAVDIGDRVGKGQILASLWVPEVEADLEQKRALIRQAEARRLQAESAVQAAQAGLASVEARQAEAVAGIKQAQADRERWQSEFTRAQQLVRERAVPGSVLDEARSKLAAAEAAIEAAEAATRTVAAAQAEARAQVEQARADTAAAVAGIEVARAEVKRAQTLLAFSQIEAPFDGVVTRRNVDTGHLTVAGAQGEPLFVIARTDVVTVAVAVPETFAATVEPGDRAVILLVANDGLRTVEGEVTRTSFALDPASRTLRAEIDLPNPDGTLRPGFYAVATIVAEEHPDALTVPATAVLRDGDKTSCVVVAANRAVRRPIKVGISDGTTAEVLAGLEPGEVVVKAGAAALTDGQVVDPVESADPPPGAPKP